MKKHLLFLLVLFSFVVSFAQRGIPPVPKEQKPLYQINTQLLNAQEEQILTQKLLRYSDSTSTQIVILIMDKTNGDHIMRFGTDVAHKWGIGQKGKDNGILLLIAIEERKSSIITGRGVEHLLTDAMSKRIVEQLILPNFRTQQYFTALDQATDRIFQILTGEYKNDKKGGDMENSIPFVVIFIIVMILLIVSSKKGGGGKHGNRSMTGPSLTDMIILSSLGRSSGGFGGSRGGGGFGGGFSGGFGGGSFGGGGAFGSW